MINEPNTFKLLGKKRADNNYELANAIAKRARQIITNQVPECKSDTGAAVTKAAEELDEGKYEIIHTEDQEVTGNEDKPNQNKTK